MVSSIASVSQHNIYTSSVQSLGSFNDYTSISKEKLSSIYSDASETTDTSFISDTILTYQNEIFSIQISTQSGVALANTAKYAADDMSSIVDDILSKLNTLSEDSTQEDFEQAQEDIDDLLDKLYDTKNSAKYNGALVFGEYDSKPSKLLDEDEEEPTDDLYMENGYFQIGYSTSDNSYLEVETAFDLGGFDITISSSSDLSSAKAVTQALKDDLTTYIGNLEQNKNFLIENNESATNYMENLVSYTSTNEPSDIMQSLTVLSDFGASLISSVFSGMIDESTANLKDIMLGIWKLS